MTHPTVGQHPIPPTHWAVGLSSWVPIANVAYSLTALFIKYAYIPFASEATIDGSRFLAKIDRESGWTPVLILIPFFGRLGVFLYDRHHKKVARENILSHEGSLANVKPWLQNDAETVRLAVRHRPLDLQYADRILRNNRNMVLDAVRGNSDAFEFASEALQRDSQIQLVALIGHPERMTRFAAQRAPDSADNETFFAEALRRNRDVCQYLPDWLPRNSRALVLSLIEINPDEYLRATEDVQQIQEVQIAAIRGNAALLPRIAHRYTPEDINASLSFFERVLYANPLALQYLPEWLQQPEHRDALMRLTNTAVSRNVHAFQFISPSLSGDVYKAAIRRMALAAVFLVPELLKYAFPREKDDLDVVFSHDRGTQMQMDRVIPHASDRIKALHQNADRLAVDEEAMLDALTGDPLVFKYYGSKAFKNDKAFMLKAIDRNPRVYRYASDALKADMDVALAAIEGDSSLFGALPTPLSFSIKLAHIAYRNNPQILDNVSVLYTEEWKELVKNPIFNDEDTLMRMVRVDPSVVLCYATEEQRKDRDFMLRAIAQNSGAFLYADDELKNDLDFVNRAAAKATRILRYLRYVRDPLLVLPFLRRHLDIAKRLANYLHPDVRLDPTVAAILRAHV